MRECEKIQKINPEPYILISFQCSNRAFYEVKRDLYSFADESEVEINDGYITEKRDFEGDLEKIIVHFGNREKPFYDLVAKKYGVDPQGLDMHLTCF